jgi:hypothetical protein
MPGRARTQRHQTAWPLPRQAAAAALPPGGAAARAASGNQPPAACHLVPLLNTALSGEVHLGRVRHHVVHLGVGDLRIVDGRGGVLRGEQAGGRAVGHSGGGGAACRALPEGPGPGGGCRRPQGGPALEGARCARPQAGMPLPPSMGKYEARPQAIPAGLRQSPEVPSMMPAPGRLRGRQREVPRRRRMDRRLAQTLEPGTPASAARGGRAHLGPRRGRLHWRLPWKVRQVAVAVAVAACAVSVGHRGWLWWFEREGERERSVGMWARGTTKRGRRTRLTRRRLEGKEGPRRQELCRPC